MRKEGKRGSFLYDSLMPLSKYGFLGMLGGDGGPFSETCRALIITTMKRCKRERETRRYVTTTIIVITCKRRKKKY